jgi:1,4-alpha-glucan branching enzyme
MVTKRYSKDGKTCLVKFQLPASVSARSAYLYGDFPEGDRAPKRMRHLSGGGFSTAITLPTGHKYRFHYVLDGMRWMNDPAVEDSMPNVLGMEESIVKV